METSKHNKNIDFIKTNITTAATYEQLAEECCELAQACLKKARRIRGENYTPLMDYEIDMNISEEYTDIILVAKEILNLKVDQEQMEFKLQRWVDRNMDIPILKGV